ncbi:hypothetical protein ACFJIX_02775 [Roseateles sp. UC29_93]|uniref:hypothetical protein n=1 Tax=Roseateles sp. UC29_93 TaxID=3350177 RepID=UPI003670918A
MQPVLEPVRQAATSVRHTLEACETHRLQVWLVVNPVRQDFELLPPAQSLEWGRQLFTSLPQRQWIHPTLMLGPSLTPAVMRRFVQLFGSRPLGIVVGPDAPPLPDMMALLGGAQVRMVFFKDIEPTSAARARGGRRRMRLGGRPPAAGEPGAARQRAAPVHRSRADLPQ